MKDEKGFSLVELLAVIVITSLVLIPLITSLIGNFDVNVRMINRSSASLITVTSIEGFNTIPFEENFINNNDINDVIDSYVAFNRDSCELFTGETVHRTSTEICQKVFDLKMIDRSFEDPERFIIYVYPYIIPPDSSIYDDMIDQAIADGVDQRVIDEMQAFSPVESTIDPRFFRITVFIQYDEANDQAVVRSGVLTEDWVD